MVMHWNVTKEMVDVVSFQCLKQKFFPVVTTSDKSPSCFLQVCGFLLLEMCAHLSTWQKLHGQRLTEESDSLHSSKHNLSFKKMFKMLLGALALKASDFPFISAAKTLTMRPKTSFLLSQPFNVCSLSQMRCFNTFAR
jgi:hypothetical protein